MRQLVAFFSLSLPLLLPTPESIAEPTAAQLLPSSVVLYADTTSSADLLSVVLDHPLREKLESLPQYQQWRKGEDYRKLSMVVKLMEAQLKTPWRPALEELGAGGIHFALDGASQSPVVLVKSDDEVLLEKAKNAIVNLALMGAAGNRKTKPFKSVDYRGVEAYRSQKAHFAIVDKWLILTNSDEVGKNIIDRMLDGSEDSLADDKQFQTALANRPTNARAWAYVDLNTIRTAGVAERLLGGKSQNPGAELILGGVLETLHQTPFATANLTAAEDSVALAVNVPHDANWIPEKREFFFGPEHGSPAPPPIALPETVLEARAYRGVSGMWLHGPDLFNDEVNAQLAKANSNLSTLFGGKPFAEEILGALDGELRLVVVREEHNDGMIADSAVKLPGIAAIARLKDPASTQRSLRIAFQTAVGFANLIGAQQGRPPLELETQRSDGRVLLSAAYSPEDLVGDEQMEMAASGAGVLLQLSPTVGFAEDSIVLASTRSLAIQVLNQVAAGPQESKIASTISGVTNSALQIHAEPLRQTLAENRERLITNNMLEKGHDRAAAVGEIDGLLTILEFFERGDANLTVDDDQLELSVRLTAAKE